VPIALGYYLELTCMLLGPVFRTDDLLTLFKNVSLPSRSPPPPRMRSRSPPRGMWIYCVASVCSLLVCDQVGELRLTMDHIKVPVIVVVGAATDLKQHKLKIGYQTKYSSCFLASYILEGHVGLLCTYSSNLFKIA
jgi:hypothetical protein